MKIFLILLLTFFSLQLFAADISSSKLLKLANDPTWLKLLHYENKKHSSIKDKDFFLATDGDISPEHELLKSLEAYSLSFDENNASQHAQCRFPARYYWLSKHLPLKDYQVINEHCKKLKNWELLNNTKSISVVFVSGFLGNPASAFGHSFLKINKSDKRNENLFDTTISFGALLTEKYNMLEYIYNGITGGYFAAYTDKYFYNQDITYSNEEFRDMWEYRLNLTKEQKTLFLLHAWELMTKRFQYFFTNRNCGYRVSKFLELVEDEKIVDSAYVWYAPIETFYKLKNVSEIKYIPSKQETIYKEYKGLNRIEQQQVDLMIRQRLTEISAKRLTVANKINILNFVIDYQKYRLFKVNKDKEPLSESEKRYNRKLLLSRLTLPAGKKRLTFKKKKPITENNKPTFISLSWQKVEHDNTILLGFSPFAMELLGDNGFRGDELVVLDTDISLSKDSVTIANLDLIRIQRLKTKQLPFDKENPFSWNLHITTEKNPKEKRDFFVDVGGGLAWEITEDLKLFTMLNLSTHCANRHLRYRPNIGLFGYFNRYRFQLTAGYEKDTKDIKSQTLLQGKLQYKLNHNISVYTDYNKNENESYKLGLKYFF